MDELSHEDLIEYALELQRQIEEKEDEIADLTQSQTGKGKGKRATNATQRDEMDALESENEDLRTQIEAGQLTISDLREQLSNSNVKCTTLQNEKTEADKKIRAQTKRLEELEKEIVEVNNRGRSAELQSKEFNKQKSANVKEAQRLWDENESLKDEIKEMEAQMHTMDEEKAFMEGLIAKLADEKDEYASKVDAAELEMDEAQAGRIELEKLLEETQLRLQSSNELEGQLELKVSALEQELVTAREKLSVDSKNHQQEIKTLKEQISILKDTTKVGEKQRALEALQAETADSGKLLEELHASLESAVAERDMLAEKLLELEHSIEQRVVDRIATERNRTKELELTIESLKQHHADNLEHYQHLEVEKAQLVRDVDELSNWKAVYEAGHGLQEMSRNQKKLKDDNRRLGVAVEQYNNKLSMVMDANGVLTQAFERLKKEAGKPADFMYPEYELQNEVLSTNASLQSQMKELEEQVISLEYENTRIRTAMKNQAASVGEQGFKYAGMTADMLLQVNDFASNLREGKVELPLNDRSQALLKENRVLKADMEALKLRLERYERELGGAVFSPRAGSVPLAGAGSGGVSGDPAALSEDMQRIANENAALHAKMNALQTDLSQLLMRPTTVQITEADIPSSIAAAASNNNGSSGGMISANELSNILLQNNQMMMREMESIRRSQQPYGSQQHATAQPNLYRADMGQSISDAIPMATSSGRSGPLASAMDRAQAAYKTNPATQSATPAASNTVTFAGVPSTPAGGPSTAQVNRNGGVGVAGVPYTPMWTPAMSRGGMPFAGTGPLGAGPATPHGKQLLNNTLNQLNLPPEEWALDVRDLNSQLIECLEQLYLREQELEDTNAVVSTLEENLVSIKQQMTALYYDYAQRAEMWEQRESTLKKEHVALNEERDDLRLKLRRMQDMADLLQREDKESIGLQLTDLTRKVTIYEVNEAVLSRKYIAQSEQLQQEQVARQHLESDFVEMETSLKKRILYLEQYKLAAGARLGHLQGRVDSSVPQADYVALQSEIDVLREDHLNTLRREVEARMSALKALDQARELRSARIIIAQLQSELEGARAAKVSCEAELIHQKEVTGRALAASNSSAEVSQLVSELARFRGEASRLEVELMASNRRAELIGERVQDVSREADQGAARVYELERREDELSVKESAARKSALDMQLKYEGGLTREETDELKAKLDKCERTLEEARRETLRHKELAEIASNQAQALSSFRKQNESELKELREYCTRLESRSDDELLIGRLQRKLMSTTTSYKAFTRKYHQAREAMRKRELGMRILESRLDEKEQAVMKAQEANRLEVSALKKALINLKNTVFESTDAGRDASAQAPKVSKGAKAKKVKTLAKSGFATVTVGAKLVDVSVKVDSLAVQAEEAVNRAAECEEECRELKGRVEDLLAERYILEQRTRDLDALTKGKSKQQAIASRLIALSDDVRSNKIAYLQQRRQVQVLRQEKRHLQSIISNIEADVMELEEGKVMAETKHILFDINEKTGLSPSEEEEDFTSALLNISSGDEGTPRSKSSSKKTKGATGAAEEFPQREPVFKAETDTKLSLDIDMIQKESSDEVTAEEMYEKLQTAHRELAGARRELSEYKLKAGSLMGQVADMESVLSERDGQINYYERVLTEEGFPAVLLRNQPHNRKGQPLHGPGAGRQYRLLHDEQEKIQEAASATIGSLRALLEEKNRIIDKYRDRMERAQTGHPTKSRAERRADELLDRIAADDSEEARARRYGAVLHPEVFSTGIGHASESERQHHQQLLSQIEQADSIIAEKDRTLAQLEQKLLAENNQRERAEVRCGESIKEMEAMKEDMITLVQQLQESQARCAHLGKTSTTRTIVPPSDNARVKELEKIVKAKNEKVKEYRTFIVNLKEEFIKSEQKAADTRSRPREVVDSGHSSSMAANAEEIRVLKDKIEDMRDAIKGAKQDLDHARKHHATLKTDREQAEARAKALEAAAVKAEQQMQNAQKAYHRARGELEDSRKKEVRLREKLKDVLEEKGGATTKEALSKARQRIEDLERENDVLRAQKAGLQRTDGEKDKSGTSGGHVLGTGAGTVDESRKPQHEKWLLEQQKFKKRLEQLEERLQVKIQENNELQLQVQKGREALESATVSKTELQKKAQASQRQASETRRLTAEDLSDLEQCNAKIFALEEELVRLRRKAHVEQTNEISALQHHISVQRARIGELEAEVAENEIRRKRNAASGGARTLRDSEDQFHKEERLRDDLDLAKRQKLELEAALLDRDSHAIESKFDLEASELEVERLKRRVKELEHAYKGLSALTQQGPLKGTLGTPAAGTGGGGVGGKREHELEGTVEAMKRVIDKLKTENDRMKKGSGGNDDRRFTDLERKYQSERKRVEQLEEEAKALQSKMKGHEESSQKIVQRQQQVAQLRKQLKGKEDELAAMQEQAETTIVERETLKKKVGSMQDRINELEINLHKQMNNNRTAGSAAAAGGATDRDIQELRRQISTHVSENDNLRLQVSELRKTMQQLQAQASNASGAGAGAAGGRGGGGAAAGVSAAEVQRLREENTKLRSELSAFDMDFFEEIENLKYAHAEAVRKLRMYESAAGDGGGSSRLGGLRS